MKPILNIVSFDIPYPANYGGVIDVFYKLKSLSEQGVEIILHCFEYRDRTRQHELEKYCSKVYYYNRKKWVNPFQVLPYIVASRNHPQLLQNLLLNDAPILFEALHSCFFLGHPKLAKRQKIVRMHNIEHDYYRLLAEAETIFLKKAYYKFESRLLINFEQILAKADYILAISPNDYKQLAVSFKNICLYLPAFHANKMVLSKPGKGAYCFYHGKLSVAENHQAAMFLVNEVFSKIDIPLKICGDGVSASLKNAAAKFKNIEIIENASTQQIDELIENAQVNVLSTFQPTGIKLKLLNVLFKGRFVLTNPAMVDNTGLSDLCIVKDSAYDFISTLPSLMQQEFTITEINQRQAVLNELFNVEKDAGTLKSLIQISRHQ